MSHPYFSVFVSHLPLGISNNDLRQLGSTYGVVEDVYINSASLEQTWTYGFIRFSELEAAVKAAKELNGWRYKNEKLVVELAKATRQTILHRDPIEGQSLPTALPTVDPSVQLPVNQESNYLLDKVVNLNRLQDICSMLNFEAHQTKDTIYVNKIMTRIEETKFSHKVPAGDLKLSNSGQTSLTSLGLNSSSEEFQIKLKDVTDKVQTLICSESALNKTARQSQKSHHHDQSSPRKSSVEKCPEANNHPSSASSPSTSGSENKCKDSPNIWEGSRSKTCSNVASGEITSYLGELVRRKRDVARGTTHTKTTEEMCGSDLNHNKAKSASQSADEPNSTCGEAVNSLSCPLLNGSLSALTSSKLYKLSNPCLKAAAPPLDGEEWSQAENSTDNCGVQCVNNLEELLSAKMFPKLMRASEETWGEEKEKNMQRKNRSEWASELFFQILSDHSDSSMSADDSGLSLSEKQFKNVSSSSPNSNLMPPSLKYNSQLQYTGRETSE